MLRFKRIHRSPKQLPLDPDRQVQARAFGFALGHVMHTTLAVEQIQRQHDAITVMAPLAVHRISVPKAFVVWQRPDYPFGK